MDLKRYGLNMYEAEAYTSLLKHGILTAYEVSKNSNVPNGKIYPVLSSLEKKGFVKGYAGMPKKFVAIDPKITLVKAMQQKETELRNLKENFNKTEKALSALSNKTNESSLEKLSVIEGYKNYLSGSVNLHRDVKQEWLTISRLPVYKPHLDSYKDCVKRGVQVKILACQPLDKANLKIWKKTGAEIRSIDLQAARFSVIDGKEVVIRLSGEDYLALWIKRNLK